MISTYFLPSNLNQQQRRNCTFATQVQPKYSDPETLPQNESNKHVPYCTCLTQWEMLPMTFFDKWPANSYPQAMKQRDTQPTNAMHKKNRKRKNYAGSKNHSPHQLRKKATLVPSTVKLLHREKERNNQWGSRGLQAWPETGSWWESITVLERARLVWTSLAVKFTECTWSLEASFLTTWESRPSSLKGFCSVVAQND